MRDTGQRISFSYLVILNVTIRRISCGISTAVSVIAFLKHITVRYNILLFKIKQQCRIVKQFQNSSVSKEDFDEIYKIRIDDVLDKKMEEIHIRVA